MKGLLKVLGGVIILCAAVFLPANAQEAEAWKGLRSVLITISYSPGEDALPVDTSVLRTTIELELRRDGFPLTLTSRTTAAVFIVRIVTLDLAHRPTSMGMRLR